MFYTKIDTLNEYDGHSLVVMLGDCQLPDGMDSTRVCRFSDAGEEALVGVSNIPVPDFKDGITYLVSSKLIEVNYPNVRLIQKHLVYCFMKYIWFAKHPSATPDPYGIGGDKGPLAGLLYQVNALSNLPHLISSTRTKDLSGNLPATPVMLLAPGPSLADVAPHIKKLNRSFLTVCISRSLYFCREHGIVPDIVVQLDTHGEQQNYYPDDVDYSQTWLFALSCIPADKYLNRFAGVFWLDTYEPVVYGDNYEIRNSWLSSLIPMFGVAELFSPSKVLVAGSDLARVSAQYYGAQGAEEVEKTDLTDLEECVGVYGGTYENGDREEFPIRLNSGNVAQTRLQFLATAFEAESIAVELAHTAFYNLSANSILSKELFPYAAPESFYSDPDLRRDNIFSTLSRISKAGHRPDEKKLQRVLREKMRTAERLVHDVDFVAATAPKETLGDNPLNSAGRLLHILHSFPGPARQFEVSRRIIHRNRDLLNRNLLLFNLKGRAAIGKAVPVYCYPHERQSLEESLAKRFPTGKWEFMNTWSDNNEPMENIVVAQNMIWKIGSEPLSLMTRRYAEAADYVLRYAQLDSYLIVEEVLAAPWPGEVA